MEYTPFKMRYSLCCLAFSSLVIYEAQFLQQTTGVPRQCCHTNYNSYTQINVANGEGVHFAALNVNHFVH